MERFEEKPACVKCGSGGGFASWESVPTYKYDAAAKCHKVTCPRCGHTWDMTPKDV